MAEAYQVLFSTMSGHSKKIANAISKQLCIPCYDVKSNPTIDCNTLFIVSGIYGSQCNPQLLEFANTLDTKNVKRVVLLTSSMTLTPQKQLRDALVSKGINVEKDEYICKGGFLFMKMSHPNKEEITDAVEFCKLFY